MDAQIRLVEQDASLADCVSRLNLKVIEDQALGVVFLLRFLPVQKMKALVGAQTDNVIIYDKK